MLTFAVIGCGSRARTYMKIAATMPERYQCVAAADPIAERVESIKNNANCENFKSFSSADELLAEPKLADILVIGTQDNYHFEPAIAGLKKGYHLLLEKPAAQSIEEVEEIAQCAKENNRAVILCFVLRYTAFYQRVKQIVDSGEIGEIISIQATEGVEPYHQAHSFVRGHWGNSKTSTPMIIAKCSHDTDIISWLIDSPCEKVSSFGERTIFRKERAPEGATLRCTDGCPHKGSCEFDAHRYLSDKSRWLDMVYPDPEKERTNQEVLEWLKVSPWGRCVYHCDNDVVDHQTVNMQFKNQATAQLTMTAFEMGRKLSIFGTKASLHGGDITKALYGTDIVMRHHHTQDITRIELNNANVTPGYHGHGGGDHGLVDEIDKLIAKHELEPDESTVKQNIQGHIIGFSAEISRVNGGKPVKL